MIKLVVILYCIMYITTLVHTSTNEGIYQDYTQLNYDITYTVTDLYDLIYNQKILNITHNCEIYYRYVYCINYYSYCNDDDISNLKEHLAQYKIYP